MKLSTQVLIVAVLVGVAGLTWWLDMSKTSNRDPALTRPLLNETALTGAQRIEIKTGESQVTLVKSTTGRWSVTDGSVNLPADASVIATWLESMTNIRPGSVVATRRSAWASLGLENGRQIRILDAGHERLLDLRLGDQRPGTGGQFIAFEGEGRESAYVVSTALQANTDVPSWELRRFLDVKPELVREIRFEPHASRRQKPVVLSRGDTTEAFKVAGLVAGDESEKAGELSAVESILSGLTWTRRVDPSNEAAKFALSKASKLGVALTDGRDFEFLIAPADDKNSEYFVQLEVKGPALDEDMTELNRVMKEFRITLAQGFAAKLFKTRSDFVERAVKNPG